VSWSYVDTSALVKLLVDEDETEALTSALGATTAISSVLAVIELTAVARRRRVTDGEARVDSIVAGLRLAPLSDAVLHSAQAVGSHPPLRALDLLHLATARVLEEAGTRTLFAYDLEFVAAARAEGFTVLAPA